MVALNAEANGEVDLTAADALDDLRAELEGRGMCSRWPGSSRTCVPICPRPAGLVDRIGDERILPTLPTAVRAYVQWYSARHGAPPIEDAPGLRAGQRGRLRDEVGP
jgi:sulfate permease, SulP family